MVFGDGCGKIIFLEKFMLEFFCSTHQDAEEYAQCEAVVKAFPPFKEAMKRRGIEDMDLVMVDAWLVRFIPW